MNWVGRFAYDTDNQFRAERRFPNGTVAGYFGYIGADGKAVRVKYGSVDELGFTAIQELIPDAFPESLTEEPPTTDASAALPEAPSAADAAFGLLTQPYEPVVDDARESVSVDAIEYYEARRKADPSSSGKWSFPLIEDDELPKKRTSRSVENEPYRRLFRQGLVLEQHPGEPAIIYADPDANDQLEDRYLKTARAQITLE